jgi:hypothetical protein
MDGTIHRCEAYTGGVSDSDRGRFAIYLNLPSAGNLARPVGSAGLERVRGAVGGELEGLGAFEYYMSGRETSQQGRKEERNCDCHSRRIDGKFDGGGDFTQLAEGGFALTV